MFDDFEDDLVAEDDLPAEPELAAGAGLKAPRAMEDCLGHAAAEQLLLAMAESGRMPHALIFSGPQGIGKATMAFRFARYMLKNGTDDPSASGGLFGEALPKTMPESLRVDPEDGVFRQVAAGGHPDLMTVERRVDEKTGKLKASVEIDEVRRIAPFMRLTASQGGWRVVIVDDADTMTRSAQNGLLKILEEPPANALLILVCHRIGAMVPTIRSRCRVIDFKAPPLESFSTLIGRNHGGLPARDREILYKMTRGSIGQALRLADEGGLEIVGRITALLHSWPQWPWSQIHQMAETLGRGQQDDGLRAFQDVLLWVVDSLLLAKARGQGLEPALDNEATRRLLAHYSLAEWIEIAGRLREHFDTVKTANLDKRLAVLGAFSAFESREAA